MERKTLCIAGHECVHYANQSGGDILLVQPVDEHDLEGMDRELEALQENTTQPFHLVALKVSDWQRELTPWEAPPVFGKVPFGNGASETLRFIIGELLPAMTFRRVVLGGYSLAGLFALWAGYQTNIFHAIAAASPSVWYPQWSAYAEAHMPQVAAIYLSLGDKEERTKNPVMARVGECIRQQHELLAQQNVETFLQWNEGNHFRDADLRMAKAFVWAIKIATPHSTVRKDR